MGKTRLLPLIAFCLLSLAPPAIGALETDILIGLNADVAPFGIESLIPGVSAAWWIREERALSPGADLQLYGGTGRQELSTHLYLRIGDAPVAPFGGGGFILLKGDYFGRDLADWYPELIGGIRIALTGWPVLCPMVSVRIKQNDTDKNLIGLGGIGL